MRRPRRTRSVRPPKAERRAAPGSRRDRLSVLLALVTIVCLDAAFFLSKDTQFLQFLMPGPLASAHGSIENCSTCHTKSGSGKLSWIHGFVAGDPLADSKACLTCHKMPDTAFNAHGASAAVLKQSTERLTKLAAATPVPQSARAQSIAFPTDDKVAHGLYCATCHQEHQGANFKLNKISNEQCRSCHVVKFDSFDGHHPEFENYPFKRRTPIIYDHAGHFGKHFPEVAKKDPAKRIPATCSTCHNSGADKRVMAVAPFEQTCTACHLDQMIGKERVSGPKGIAFLALPGLDLQTLKKRKASIGEWPDASEAELTPFMKVMISRDERSRALIKTVDGLNLQDLSDASDDQILAVTNLVWEIKGLFYALIKGKASDVLADLNIGGSTRLSAVLVADLTANIPRDVVLSAQQQWLPNLGTEMAATTEFKLAADSEPASIAKPSRPAQADQQTLTRSVPGAGAAKAAAAQPQGAAQKTDTAKTKPDNKAPSTDEQPQAKAADQTDDLLNPTEEERRGIAAPIKGAEKAAQPERPARKADTAKAKPDSAVSADAASKADANAPADQQTPTRSAPGAVAAKAAAAQPQGAARKADTANAKPDNKAPSTDERPQAKTADQTDDLLNPTEEERRGIAAPIKGAAKAAPPERAARPERAAQPERAVQPERAARQTDTANAKPDSAVSADAASKADTNAPADTPAASDTAAAQPQTRVAPEISIESDVDPENWAEYGGWYRQDYAIFYRPAGHRDRFIYSWLWLTGPQAPKGDRSPAAAVFDLLTDKDAQGSCAKCHSVDDFGGKGRLANFSPPSVRSKQGRFTNFIHEPHFGVLGNRGCLTCHNLEKDRPYLKSYEQGNPQNFVSNFGAVKKDLCQTCHTSSMARQDCLLCHKYHVNGVVTPIINTRIPTE
jgi:hypothetical protein